MRTTMTMLLLAAACVPACKWTEFDDLEKDTWVNSTGKPDVKSADWGVAITRGASASDATSTGTLAIVGAGPGTYSELQYGADGESKFQPTSLLLSAQGIMTIDSSPIFISSPTSSEVSLITTGDAGSIVVAGGAHTINVRQLFVNNTSLGTSVTIGTTPDAATYMQPPTFPGLPDPTPAPIVAVADIVMGTVIGLPNGTKQPACKLTDGANQIQVRAMAALPGGGGTDDVLVWNGFDGKLLRYPGSVFNGCTTQAPSAVSADADKPAFRPGHGSQVLPLANNRVLLQGHADAGGGGYLQVYDVATLKPLGNPVTAEGIRQAAVLSTGTAEYAVVGIPTAQIDGKASGQVLIYAIGATGLDTTPASALHDAQPDSNESFGRSVAVMPYRGKNVIAVAADNEIFVYFRANREDGSALYEETRQVQ